MIKANLPLPAAATGPHRHICRAACVMSDAEGYTGVAEGMDPRNLVGFVNEYFRALFRAVLRHGGAVIDVKGDGVLAVWTGETPDAAMRARVCRGALEMVEATGPMGRSRSARRLPTRIGIDFGPIALAHVGAFARYEYRAVGDTVNTCSRLQELNKDLGTRILVSQPFAEALDGYLFRDLGAFTLRGKRAALRVYELVATQDQATRQQRELCEAFAGALAAYERGRLADAVPRFGALCAIYPGDGPSRYFLRRCLERRQPAAAGAWRDPLATFAPPLTAMANSA